MHKNNVCVQFRKIVRTMDSSSLTVLWCSQLRTLGWMWHCPSQDIMRHPGWAHRAWARALWEPALGSSFARSVILTRSLNFLKLKLPSSAKWGEFLPSSLLWGLNEQRNQVVTKVPATWSALNKCPNEKCQQWTTSARDPNFSWLSLLGKENPAFHLSW